jgi:Spy/CpxP family protein refolding chaperone
MWKFVGTALTLVASLVVVGSLWAADEPGGPKGDHPPRPPKFDPIGRMLHEVTLTDAQKVKVEELKKEFAPKFKDAFAKPDDILTPEQKQARKEAVKAAKDAGKDRDEVREAGRNAVKLTDEQKKKMAESREKGRKAMQALDKEVREKLASILTPEQMKQVKSGDRHGRHRRGPPPEGGPGHEGGPPPDGGPGPGGPPPEGGPPPSP